MLEDGIGYITVDSFPKGRTQEIAGKIKELQRQGAKKLLLDLRNSRRRRRGRGHRDGQSVPQPRADRLRAGAALSTAGFQCRPPQGCHRSAFGGDGEPQHRRSGRDCCRGRSRQRARRRAGRQDLRLRLNSEGSGVERRLGAAAFRGQVFRARRQGDSRCLGHAEHSGGRRR